MKYDKRIDVDLTNYEGAVLALMIFLCTVGFIALLLIGTFVPSIIIWALWDIAICSLIPTLPKVGFWAIFFIMFLVGFIIRWVRNKFRND